MDLYLGKDAIKLQGSDLHVLYIKHGGPLLMNIANRLHNDKVTNHETTEAATYHNGVSEVFEVYPEDLGQVVQVKRPDVPKIETTEFIRRNPEDYTEKVLYALYNIGQVTHAMTSARSLLFFPKKPTTNQVESLNQSYASFGEDGVPEIINEKLYRAGTALQLFFHILLDTDGIENKIKQDIRNKLTILTERLSEYKLKEKASYQTAENEPTVSAAAGSGSRL